MWFEPPGADREDWSKDPGDRMKYSFACYPCESVTDVESSRPFAPPPAPTCVCGLVMDRVYNARIDTSGCKDHDHIPEQFRVRDGNKSPSKAGAERKEAAFRSHIEGRRSVLRENGGRGAMRQTHSVPADLYHGKIRETGDRNYWNDSANLKRHSSTRVS